MSGIENGREAVCQPLQRRRGEETRRVLRETPSLTPGIADAIVMKDRNLFFLCGPDGAVPLKNVHALGLYYHDCRYLRGYELRLAGKKPLGLVSTGARGYMSLFDLTNPELRGEDGQRSVRRDDVGIRWLRVLSDADLSLYDEISFRNFGFERIELPITLAFRPGFDDVFAVRSLMHELPGVSRRAEWVDEALVFVYEGCDGLFRSLTVRCWPPPDRRRGVAAHFRVGLDPQQERKLLVAIGLAENGGETVRSAPRVRPDLRMLTSKHEEAVDTWLRHQMEVRSSSMLLDSVIERSLCDLRLLQASMERRRYYAAGVPWFATLFGRDSLITAIQTLAFQPAIAEETLRVLAAYQGKKTDPWREEEPGKILHELRVGELARTGRFPIPPTTEASMPPRFFSCCLAGSPPGGVTSPSSRN